MAATDKHEICLRFGPTIKPNDINDSSGNRLDNIAFRFNSGLVDLIGQARRHSSATLRFLQLKIGQKWPEKEMRDIQVISRQLLSIVLKTIPQ